MKLRTIRDYRQRGLLPPAQRKGNQLFFGGQHVDALKRVAALQRRGIRFLALGDLATLTALSRWRIVRSVGDDGEFEWSGDLGLLETDLIGSRPIVGLLKTVQLDAVPLEDASARPARGVPRPVLVQQW